MAPIFPNEILFKIYAEYINSFKGAHLTIGRIGNEFSQFLAPCRVNKAVWEEVKKHDFFEFITFRMELQLQALYTGFPPYAYGLRRRTKHLEFLIVENPMQISDRDLTAQSLESYIHQARQRCPDVKSIHIVFNHNFPSSPWEEQTPTPTSNLLTDAAYANTIVSTVDCLYQCFGPNVVKSIKDNRPSPPFDCSYYYGMAADGRWLYPAPSFGCSYYYGMGANGRWLYGYPGRSINCRGLDAYSIGQLMVDPLNKGVTFYV